MEVQLKIGMIQEFPTVNTIHRKTAFTSAFSQNRIEAASIAIAFRYAGCETLEWYYEKKRLLLVAFHGLPYDAFETLILSRLPKHMQASLVTKDPDDAASLIGAINKPISFPPKGKNIA